MNDKSFQKKSLEAIFIKPTYAPLFKSNPQYCVNQFSHLTPYISYNDIINNKFIIRGSPVGANNMKDSKQREIIIEYGNIDELVNDGWKLDH